LMKHQSGDETVRTNELGTCGVGCLTRLLPCRNVSVPGIPTPQRFLYPTADWLVTAGGLGLQSGIDAEEAFRVIIKTLGKWRKPSTRPSRRIIGDYSHLRILPSTFGTKGPM
jgi:hypothetical protein